MELVEGPWGVGLTPSRRCSVHEPSNDRRRYTPALPDLTRAASGVGPDFGQYSALLRRTLSEVSREFSEPRWTGLAGRPNVRTENPTVAAVRRGTHQQARADVARL